MLGLIAIIGGGNQLLPAAFVASGHSIGVENEENVGCDISTAGLQAGDYMLVYSDRVADGVSAMLGGSGAGWTLDTLTQTGSGQKMRCQHKRLTPADVGTTLRCVVLFSGTPVRWAVYRGVARASLIRALSEPIEDPNFTFTAITRSPGSVFLVAGVAQHDVDDGDWTAPDGWNARVDVIAAGPKLVADYDSRASSPANRAFVGAAYGADEGSTAFLHELIGVYG